VLKMSTILMIVEITYLSLTNHREINFTYGWSSTAAYITGMNATIILLSTYFIVVFGITFVFYRKETQEQFPTKKIKG
jgi:amino acid transporter